MTSSIFAGDMWPVWNFGDPNLRYQKFLSQGKPRFQSFFDSVVLYDEIVIPTDDFMSLAVLVGVLGVGPVAEMFDAGAVRLARAKGSLSYIGNGGGLHAFSIKSADGSIPPVFAPADEALDRILNGLENVDKKQALMLNNKVLKNLVEVDLSSEDHSFREQTYADVAGSDYLRSQFSLGGDLSRLPGIGPEEVRIFGGEDGDNENDSQILSLLKLSHANLEMRLAEISRCSDIATAAPVGHLLRGKQERLAAQQATQGNVKLKEITKVPDIGTWILENPKNIDKLLKLHNSRAGSEFREWFHKSIAKENCDVQAEYIDFIKEVPVLQKFPPRVLRLLITSGWAAAEPLTGTAAIIVEQFFLDRFLHRSSPKFFLERLSQLPHE